MQGRHHSERVVALECGVDDLGVLHCRRAGRRICEHQGRLAPQATCRRDRDGADEQVAK